MAMAGEPTELTRYMEQRRALVLSIAGQYIESLGLPASVMDDMESTFNWLWDCFPLGSKYHSAKYFAEILVFHVLKDTGRFTDPEAFCRISPLGDMSMFRRPWLLRYKKYLPREAFSRAKVGPETYLDKACKLAGNDFATTCDEVKKVVFPRMQCNTPRMAAAVTCYAAYKTRPVDNMSLSSILEAAGTKNSGSVYNAARRFKKHHGIDLDHLDVPGLPPITREPAAQAHA